MIESPILNQYSLFSNCSEGNQLFRYEETLEEIGVTQSLLLIFNDSITEVNSKYNENTRKAVASFKCDHGLAKDFQMDPLFDQKVVQAMDGRILARVYRGIRNIHPQKGLQLCSPTVLENQNEMAFKVATDLFPFEMERKVKQMLRNNPQIFHHILREESSDKGTWLKIAENSPHLKDMGISSTDFNNIFGKPDRVWISLSDFIIAQNWFRIN